MTQFQSGADALTALNTDTSGGDNISFSSFKSGTTYKVRALGVADVIRYFGYGVFQSPLNGARVNTFIAENPSEKNGRGFAESNLTPWDKVSKYFSELMFKAKDAGDKTAEELNKDLSYAFRAKERYVFGFIDLETGEPLYIDLTKPQSKGISAALAKYAKKLGELPFELSKDGKSTSTVVSLSPFLDDLTDKEQANFDAYNGKEFESDTLSKPLYVADDADQISSLTQAGFDVKLIGLSPTTDAPAADSPVDNTQVAEMDLPF